MMHVFDTDALTLLHFGHRGITRRIADLPRVDGENLAITIISQIEVFRGRHERLLKADTVDQLVDAQERLSRSELFLMDFIRLPLTLAAAQIFERLTKHRKARRIGRADLLIASIVLANDAILITRNWRDFEKFANLKLENWIDH